MAVRKTKQTSKYVTVPSAKCLIISKNEIAERGSSPEGSITCTRIAAIVAVSMEISVDSLNFLAMANTTAMETNTSSECCNIVTLDTSFLLSMCN
ncbi:hypothetical protein SDC9_109512 [bioreactor metagenome]|uniref:Uncharacterized protein n=1 Tax=bioreactor metagenome TaxID=1076179 RepID=A0A645BB08_9ZZZZ